MTLTHCLRLYVCLLFIVICAIDMLATYLLTYLLTILGGSKFQDETRRVRDKLERRSQEGSTQTGTQLEREKESVGLWRKASTSWQRAESRSRSRSSGLRKVA